MGEFDNIRLKPCPHCGGLPLMLVMRQAFESVVNIQCSKCGVGTCGVIFANRRMMAEAAGRRDMLPDLATARRQVAAAWNERTGADGQD